MADLQWEPIDSKAVDTTRILAADAVEKVGNGHPGTAMSLAPAAYLLFQKVMRRDPSDSTWIGRDRFILSVGHSSLTQYVQFYLGGYGLELDDLQGSCAPGDRRPPATRSTATPTASRSPPDRSARASPPPSASPTPPASSAVCSTRTPPTGTSPFDHFIYVIAGDGDLQEGVTSEASSLAGHQQLGNLVVIYDSNQISIEDDTNIAFTEDVAKRYASYDWDVQTVDWKKTGEYVEDVQELHAAIERAKGVTDKPSLIILKTIIGWPSPKKQNSGKIHGSALGAEELAAVKEVLGLRPRQDLRCGPRGARAHPRRHRARPGPACRMAEVARRMGRREPRQEGPAGSRAVRRAARRHRRGASGLPRRQGRLDPRRIGQGHQRDRPARSRVLGRIGGPRRVEPHHHRGRRIVRPHRVVDPRVEQETPTGASCTSASASTRWASILNGIVLHGNTRPFGGTFLIFSDYMRPALRLAALMKAPTIYVWTHDSVALGEDGPTHQPIEQIATLRAIPDFDVVRPADANETAWAWKTVLERRKGPAGIALSRQNLPVFERGDGEAEGDTFAHARGVAKGAYILAEAPGGTPDVIFIATGSEVQIGIDAREKLAAEGINARVVSAPSLEWFAEQSAEYQEKVLPKAVTARVSIEAGIALTWRPIVGDAGRSVSIEHFGASADYKTLFEEFGITTESAIAAAKDSIAAAGA